MSINTKAESLIIDKIQKIFILFLNKEKILSYHSQQDIISNMPNKGALQYINLFRGCNFLVSLVSNFAASEIGCSNPQIKTLLGPFR